jgi:hypothetical protein
VISFNARMLSRGSRRAASAIGILAALAMSLVLLLVPVGAAPAAVPATVPVADCPTTFGIQHKAIWPKAAVVRGNPASTRGLVAYSNTELLLIGPRGMQCAGVVAVDGGTNIIVWPHGYPRPATHARSDGLTLLLDPACLGCKAEDACPFFTQFATALGIPCATGIPAGERVYGLNAHITLFEDPPGVAGSGWPSGGPDPANGLVGVNGGFRYGTVFRSTCTLPQTQHSLCTVILNDVIARYG